MEVVTVFPLPVELLRLARWATGQALRPGADFRPTIMCVMFVVGAAEGIVNTFLEPLVPPDEWQDPSRRDAGLNWASPYKKWVKLSEKLKMRPQLDVEKEPLQALLRVVDLRNELLHFNLGRNMSQTGIPAPVHYDRGHVSVGPPDAASIDALRSDLSDRLTADKALGYFHALAGILRAVLPLYPPDPFGFTANISQLIAQDPQADGQ
jgi:hypothetical protein